MFHGPAKLTAGRRGSLAATRARVQNAPMTEQIPTLSLRDADTDRFVRDLGQAYAEHGFVIIADHGIPQPLIDRFLGLFKTFFAWPETDKRRYHVAGGGGARELDAGRCVGREGHDDGGIARRGRRDLLGAELADMVDERTADAELTEGIGEIGDDRENPSHADQEDCVGAREPVDRRLKVPG